MKIKLVFQLLTFTLLLFSLNLFFNDFNKDKLVGEVLIDTPRIYSYHFGEEKTLMSPSSLIAAINDFKLQNHEPLDNCLDEKNKAPDLQFNSFRAAQFKGNELILLTSYGNNAEQIKICLIALHKAIEGWENERYEYILSADRLNKELNTPTLLNTPEKYYRNFYRASKILSAISVRPVGYKKTVTNFFFIFLLSALITIGIFNGKKLFNYKNYLK